MILGPSYTLSTRKAAVQRSVNLMLRRIESGEKSGGYLQQIPGLRVLQSLGASIRGMYVTATGRAFAVAGATLYEILGETTSVARGSLLSTDGPVSMASGLTHLLIADGDGYALELTGNVFARITDPDFEGARSVAHVDGYMVTTRAGSQQFQISAINNGTNWDALDFASAESTADNLTAVAANQREVWLFAGAADFPFARIQGATLEVGCVSPWAFAKVDNSLLWVGRDRNGSGIVYRANGYQSMRVSTFAVEEVLRSGDLSQATCYAYQQDGASLFVVNVPDLSTQWVYDISAAAWHERADLTNGELVPHRGTHHAFAFGMHMVGGTNGVLYALDPDVYTQAGDVLYRERTTPHSATQSRNRVCYHSLRLDCEVGMTPQGVLPVVELSYSDDGGMTWSGWSRRSLGEVGEYGETVTWHRLGQARDRVWRIRTTDNARASIVGAFVDASEGVS